MKRILYLILPLLLTLVACTKEATELRLSTSKLEIPVEGATRMLSVTCDGAWTMSLSSGVDWCYTDITSARGNANITITVDSNQDDDMRTAELTFSANGLAPVIVTVSQKGNKNIEIGGENTVSPDLTSGITVDPSVPDADSPCTIKFNPASGNPLYNHSGNLYAHLGVVVEGEWMFVPCDWGVANAKCKFTKVADNSWELELKPSIREFFASGETPINKIAIIVRSEDGSIKSHDADQYCSVTDNKYQFEEFTPHEVLFEALPANVKPGININQDNSVTFVLYEKNKSSQRHKYCYIVGDWNDWKRTEASAMKRDNGEGCWWLTLSGFDPDKEYRFQYRIGTNSGTELRVSDPYTEIVYDQWNDQYISSATYPNLPTFPSDAKALVSAFKINEDVYDWKVQDFKVEDKDDLVIYEMLLRDFSTTKDINGALAQLDYIENLGVNAIELMPIQEFDGNLSWGYNPNHYFALDKAYGTREMYKEFIDECHRRGLAVIVDVVYNHLTGLNAFAKLYYEGDATTAANPFFNMTAPHPYSVFHDINHDNEIITDYIKRSLIFLLTEYNIDGFRFDLTKGFTNNSSDEGSASKYDADRVRILKSYNDCIKSVDQDAIVILEHFCDDKEEKELAHAGMKVWRNVNAAYREAVAGSAGNFSSMWTGTNDMKFGAYVGFMESHDEERLCYGLTGGSSSVSWGLCGTMTSWGASPDISMAEDNHFFVAKNVSLSAEDKFKIRGNSSWNDAYNYGAGSDNFKLPVGKAYEMTLGSGSKDMYIPAAGTYDIYFCPELATIWLMTAGTRPADPQIDGAAEDQLTVAMRRAAASAAFFLTVPGPKMIWQFGEIGYDYSINYNDRTGEKPVVTDEYMAVPARKALYDTYAKLLKFRKDNPRFFDSDASFQWNPSASTKTITCSVDGKTFHVVGNFSKSTITYNLPSGTWVDYMNGGTADSSLSLKQGEFRLLTNF